MKQYRIEWIYIQTNYKGHGKWFHMIDKREVDELNKKYKGLIEHRIVSSFI